MISCNRIRPDLNIGVDAKLTNYGDDIINILDLSACGACFDAPNPICPDVSAADVNADGDVDVYDLVLIGKNFGYEGPEPVVFCGL